MSDTFHIKRFKEYQHLDLQYYGCVNGAYHEYSCCEKCWNNHPNPALHLGLLSSERVGQAIRDNFTDPVASMLNDLAHHLEQEHERNNYLQEQLDVLHRGTFKAYSDIATLEKRIDELELRFNSNAHPHPKGENN